MREHQAYYQREIEAMPRSDLEGLQLHRLRWQIARCYAGSAFYRERLDAAGVAPEDVRSLDDVRRIPVVTKQQLRDEQMAHPPFGRYTVAPRDAWRELHPSTGTTGVPVATIWSERDCQHISEFAARTQWCLGIRPGDIVQNALTYGLWVGGLGVHYGSTRLGAFVIPISAATTDRQIEYLCAGSTVLMATPSYLLHIAETLRQRGISPDSLVLRLGCLGGEAGAGTPATRTKIETGLGIDAMDYYGLAEIAPAIAAECSLKAGLHWTEDHHLIELINPETMQPCAPGEIGVLVITHLTREATPMLRYWTNDYARLVAEPCACGRTHARSTGGILGRHDELLIYRGVKFYPIQVEQAVRSFPELSDEFQIELCRDERSGADRCTVVVEAATGNEPPRADLVERVGKALREALQVGPEVRLESFGTLERTAFKARRIVDLRAPAATEPGGPAS